MAMVARGVHQRFLDSHPPIVNFIKNNRRKKVVELKRLGHDMGLDTVLHPLIMDSCHIVLPKERREERVSRCACMYVCTFVLA